MIQRYDYGEYGSENCKNSEGCWCLIGDVERIAHYLRIYIHAHQTGNSVPPHIEQEAIDIVKGFAEP